MEPWALAKAAASCSVEANRRSLLTREEVGKMSKATTLRRDECGFVLLLLAVGIVAAQTATWEQLMDSGTEFQAKGRYAEAEVAFRSALEKAEASANPPLISRSLSDLGRLLEICGDYSGAEELLLKAVAILEALPESLNLAVALHNLANMYREQGQFDRAEPLCRRALEIRRRFSGPEGSGI